MCKFSKSPPIAIPSGIIIDDAVAICLTDPELVGRRLCHLISEYYLAVQRRALANFRTLVCSSPTVFSVGDRTLRNRNPVLHRYIGASSIPCCTKRSPISQCQQKALFAPHDARSFERNCQPECPKEPLIGSRRMQRIRSPERKVGTASTADQEARNDNGGPWRIRFLICGHAYRSFCNQNS